MSTRIADLTETQLLEEIRKAFEDEAMTGIDQDELINSSNTLEELLIKIQAAIDVRNSQA
jgi:hypothetical protein